MNYKIIISIMCLSFILIGCSQKTINIHLDPETSGLTIYKYDFEQETSSVDFSYHGENFDEAVAYFSNLKGIPQESVDLTKFQSTFYGIEMNDVKLLIIGDVLITGEGKLFKIDGDEAIEYCESVKNDHRIGDLDQILNQRYISLIDNNWDTTYMLKSKIDKFSQDIKWIAEDESISDDVKELKTTIYNNGKSDIEFGSRIWIEVLLFDDWYNVNSMTHSNVNLAWNDLLYRLESDGKLDTVFRVNYFQPLPKGKYRLVKQITRESKDDYIYLEFLVK